MFYASPDEAWNAFVNGQADCIQWSLTETQKLAAEQDPNIQLARSDGFGIMEFDLNNNYTIATYPGVRSATNELQVRRAIARLIDKDYIVTEILEDFAARIDVPIGAGLSDSSWINQSVVGDNYPYPYDPEAAAQLLTEAGFSDTDGNGWLNYPADWDGAPNADTEAYPLVVCVRSDDSNRFAVGQYLIDQLENTLRSTSIGAGFKTTGTQWQQPRSVLSPKIHGDRNYQVYTGGWSGSRLPTYLFGLYHSMWWYPYGSNYVTGVDKYGNPNYPDLDDQLDLLWLPPIPNPDPVIRCKNAQSLIVAKHCINIPLWSYSYYYSYRKELLNVCSINGLGVCNQYTFLNAHRQDGGSIRLGIPNGPSRLNILYSQLPFEYGFLDLVYTGAISEQPYDLTVDQPWVIQDWESGAWFDPQDGYEKTVVTYYIRKDVGIVAPVTGAYIRNWDAHDFEFTVWYNYAFTDSWQWGSFMDIKYTKIVDVNSDSWDEFQVYFDDQSYWFYTAPTYPLMTKDELLDPLCATTVESWTQTGTTPYMLANSVVQVVSATLNGAPIYEGIDFIIKAGYDLYSHIGFHPLRDLTGTISITYWYANMPASGFYLAGLPWQQTMYSLGTHYPVSMTHDPPTSGDEISLRKNSFLFFETPLLGEIDWQWHWEGSVKPRSGYFKIEIYDVVKATAAYSTRGDGVFDARYFPGADIDSNDLCHIGIFDLVTITSLYGKKFGTPPP